MEREVEEVEKLYQRVEALQLIQGKEVSGVDIIHTFLKHRVQPLQARAHPMFLYSGASDPMRVSKEEMSSNEMDKVLRTLLNHKADENLLRKSLTSPFHSKKKVPQVQP